MNRSRVLTTASAMLVASVIGSLLYLHSRKSRENGTGSTIDVVVAARDLHVGARLQDKDVCLVNVPASRLPGGVYRQLSEVIGRDLILPISKGEFLLPNKLAAENVGAGLPALIPPGMRAVSVRVNEVVSVAGFVRPGARVDVLLTGNPTSSNEPQTNTVLENVEVVAVGQELEHNTTGDAQSAPVITLLVSPNDAQKLAVASTQGRIQLSLRNPIDPFNPIDPLRPRIQQPDQPRNPMGRPFSNLQAPRLRKSMKI